MALSVQTIVSASRRTDIPAFYMEWFFQQLRKGGFEVENPFNRQIRTVFVSPEKVHTFVFWSKNFGPFLKEKCGERLLASGYHLFFNFSLNSENWLLEPNLPPLKERLLQLTQLCERFGPKCVTWRFDPICFFRADHGEIQNNLSDFSTIARVAANCGVRRCTTSFLDMYGKAQRRAKRLAQILFHDPCEAEKATLLQAMARQLRPLNIALETCCEPKILSIVNDAALVTAAKCIPSDLIMALYGGRLSLRADSSQRIQSGCKCRISTDIGSYGFHPCHHDCLYCYANPSCDGRYLAPIHRGKS